MCHYSHFFSMRIGFHSQCDCCVQKWNFSWHFFRFVRSFDVFVVNVFVWFYILKKTNEVFRTYIINIEQNAHKNQNLNNEIENRLNHLFCYLFTNSVRINFLHLKWCHLKRIQTVFWWLNEHYSEMSYVFFWNNLKKRYFC